MTETTYEIVEERHVMPHGNDEIVFKYAIRRADGSLVYRAETKKYAEQLLRRLRAGAKAA